MHGLLALKPILYPKLEDFMWVVAQPPVHGMETD